MSTAHYFVGDTRDVTARLPDGSVDLVLTSPPFLALRSYLPADHPGKGREIGSEANPAAFLDVLLELTAEWGRVLAPHGSIAVELGDTYAGSRPDYSKYLSGEWASGSAESVRKQRTKQIGGVGRSQPTGLGWPLDKSLTLVPELYRIALAYGINPLTGAESPAGRWRVRNVVRWHRPNPPVGALGDKYRPATTDLVVATRARDRWFDLDAVRVPHSRDGHTTRDRRMRGNVPAGEALHPERADVGHPAGAPPLDTWTIPTHPYKGAHYATWPPALCEIPIRSMVPLERCTICGTPRRRITESTRLDAEGQTVTGDWNAVNYVAGQGYVGDQQAHTRKSGTAVATVHTTLGWSDCPCTEPNYRPGIVLDPFAGTGTTLAVATGHGRRAVGIDIDDRNLDLARERIGGLMLTEGDELPEWLT